MLFWFSEHLVWIEQKMVNNYTFNRHLIKDVFPNLNDDIDAAYSDDWNDVYFFKGPFCWKYKMNSTHIFTLYSGYPTNITNDFPGIPSDIDAATRVFKNGSIYFFKGT